MAHPPLWVWLLLAAPASVPSAAPQGEDTAPVDLSDDSYASLAATELADEVYARPWYENVELYGYAAATFVDSGPANAHDESGFTVREATLFVDALAWEDVSVFTELRIARLQATEESGVRTGELYVRFHDVFATDERAGVDVKVGRVDIPFGEEYLWQDAHENPLIQQSVVWPYGYDEGLVVSGGESVEWVAAVLDGSIRRSFDESSSKSYTLKVAGRPSDDVYLSASGFWSGDTAASAMTIGASLLSPVGREDSSLLPDPTPSTAGVSPSNRIEAGLAELDLRWQASEATSLSFSVGAGRLDDRVDAFDRDLLWFVAEPWWYVEDDVYLVARYSEIGTNDEDEGYRFDGKPFGFGRALGYDAHRHRRVSLGAGWEINPHATLKLEVAWDAFDVITGSPLDPQNGDRFLVGLDFVAEF